MRRWLVIVGGVALLGAGAAVGLRAGWRASHRRDPLTTFEHALPPGGPAPAGAPNLVLVIGCTVRQDQTTPYGGPDTTPHLAAIGAAGARLADPFTAAPWTRAASTAILTGRHPIEVGMAEPSPARDERVLPDSVVTLAEHLHANGYHTVGLTTNPNLSAVYGFDQGFDRYRQPAELWRDNGAKVPGRRAVSDALALVDAGGPGPLYLQIVLIDAHSPFAVTDEEAARFAETGLPDEVARYRAALRQLDDAVATLDQGLQARGFTPDNTVFAFTNDHGDGLAWPAHHGWSHGRYLAPSSVGGVVVARGPGIAPGGVVDGVWSQVDLAPTLSALLGLPPFPAPGFDLSPALRGGEPAAVRDRAYVDTWFKEVSRAAVYTTDAACQLDFAPGATGRGAPFTDGCFDRRADPLHEHPTANPALEAELRGWRDARVAEARAFGPVDRAEPDASTRAQLEALGYAE
ncbi:MAG: sulfatase-like hydrolase/transferase [Myxococcota bacterium]